MDPKQLQRALMEMFPKLTEAQARSLVLTGDDFSVLVTRVLDNNIGAPMVPLKEMTYRGRAAPKVPRVYNYPEVFRPVYANRHGNVEELRHEAGALHREAEQSAKYGSGQRAPEVRTHYGIENDVLRERAGHFNREAAMLIMRRSLEQGGPIDLHGLYVNEALKFLDDYLVRYRPKDIVLVTGRQYNSARLRPAVEKWLKDNNFMVHDEGPSLHGVLKPDI
ncbi:hypothetical protein PAPHI01_1826 [Pancytospora philotis]|nr:hypothetical protein PAPHI01_1826 [Pancytospora philotis]